VSKLNTAEQATVKAVLVYAEKLCLTADRQIAGDPYARPYQPTTKDGRVSEDAIRKLCQRLGKQRELQLPAEATAEDKAAARAQGPADALEYLRLKAAAADREAREEAQASQHSLERHARRQAKHKRAVKARRLELTPGQRIDQALAALATISNVPAAVLDGDRVHGGERNQAPQWGGDSAGDMRSKATKLALEIEESLDSARARDVQQAA
jgi:hypothetical protein